MVDYIEIIVKLLLGTLLGGIIGLERQKHGRPAGVRTHLLVCMASVIIMIVSDEYYRRSQLNPAFIRIDPARIAAGAITGVGFLGAGVIIKSGFTIQGLTTAACLWVVSAIGLAVGSGLYVLSFTGFVITFFTLWTLRRAETKISQLRYKTLTITTGESDSLTTITKTIKEADIDVGNIDYEMDREKNEFTYHITFSYSDRGAIDQVKKSLIDMSTIKRFYLRG